MIKKAIISKEARPSKKETTALSERLSLLIDFTSGVKADKTFYGPVRQRKPPFLGGNLQNIGDGIDFTFSGISFPAYQMNALTHTGNKCELNILFFHFVTSLTSISKITLY
ncbi:hypothetical protein D3C74_403610 [compost metagenome]